MSLLKNLLAKKNNLKQTTTQVTRLDGRKFEENALGPPIEIPGSPFGFIVDTKPDIIPAKITNNLYLGSQDCCDLKILTEHDITCVLSVGVPPLIQYNSIIYKFVPCLDLPETNLKVVVEECVDFVNTLLVKEKDCKVLVHCNAGVSRSASVIIGYLILDGGFSFFDAYEIVKKARNCVRPNDGFIKQLKLLQGNT